VYYFLTIGFSVSNTVLLYAPSVAWEWRGLLLEPTFTIASILACRLFRELKLSLSMEPMTEGAISHVVFRDIGTIPQQSSGETSDLGTIDDLGTDTCGVRDAWDIENPAQPHIASKERQSCVQE